MPSSSPKATFSALSPPIRSRSSSRESAVLASEGEAEQDQLAFTIESPSRPQLQLFETIFNTGKPLASYCRDDPLWSTLTEVALPCSNCVKHPEACKVPEGSPRCSSCTGKKTCSLGKILRHRYFSRRCNQDLAYSRRFLELHGSPAQRVSWSIPEDIWRRYDVRLHSQISSTSILMELNMLDNQDTQAVDRRELARFQRAQEQEAALALAAKCKRALTRSQPGASEIIAGEVPRVVRLVFPPACPPPPPSSPTPPRPSSSDLVSTPRVAPVSRQTGSVWDPDPLVQLAEVAGRQTGFSTRSAAQLAIPIPSAIKGPQEVQVSNVPSSPAMPPILRPALVPRNPASHPYRAENQRLAARVRLLESQLADSQQENSSLTSALRDTSHALESRQREVEQLRSSSQEFLQHQEEYRHIIDQFNTLDRALSGPSDQSLLERFQKVEEELRITKKDRDDATGKLSASSRRISELTTALLYQHGITDEGNALSTRQCARLEELQEEVHRTRGRAAFVERMIKEYPDEGYYEVVLPPLSQLEGDLVKVRADLRRVATLAHHLYRSDPATVLHHHNRYIGAIIEAVVAFLRRALETEDPNVMAHNVRLALDYMQTAHGVHGDLHIRSLSSIQWFFNNAVDQDEGLYTLMLENSRFDSDRPFLTAAQHAGFTSPPPDSLEPPLHRRMLSLSMALPHRGGAGRTGSN
ncbi:hypothetical protein F5879DRAFT_996315 [Lentinula edodes]|nr:hypothetical protein F5879DRAFT_996315 [Lentinula edodes]